MGTGIVEEFVIQILDIIEIIVFFNKILHLFLDISEKKLDNIDMYELSAGMSDDYEEAVRNGSTVVRLGRAIFGERQ